MRTGPGDLSDKGYRPSYFGMLGRNHRFYFHPARVRSSGCSFAGVEAGALFLAESRARLALRTIRSLRLSPPKYSSYWYQAHRADTLRLFAGIDLGHTQFAQANSYRFESKSKFGNSAFCKSLPGRAASRGSGPRKVSSFSPLVSTVHWAPVARKVSRGRTAIADCAAPAARTAWEVDCTRYSAGAPPPETIAWDPSMA
jgi:hypothetical protein